MLIAHALQNDWKISLLDIPTAFLHGNVTINVYLKIPGVKVNKNYDVLKLRKALYGL